MLFRSPADIGLVGGAFGLSSFIIRPYLGKLANEWGAQRLSEVRRLGFTKCLIPARNSGKLQEIPGLQLIPVRNIREALAALL